MKLRLHYYRDGKVYDTVFSQEDDWCWYWLDHIMSLGGTEIWFFTADTTDIF